jgi:hypothetical protein
MANLDFKTDLIIGQDGETIVKDFLVSKGCIFINSNNDFKYDLKMKVNDKIRLYEIKTDVTCTKKFDTGNIFIEFQSRNKPSGISTTQAHWFVTYFKYLDQIWFIKTKVLKKLIKDNDYRIVNNAGDINSNTCGYLINRNSILEFAHIYDIKT